MGIKTVRKVIPAKKINMGGHLLDQPLPADGVDQIDPFLLIHHWDQPIEGGFRQAEMGVPPHPHRGFSPVTFIFKGDVHHRDSLGNDAIVGAGGTQWMHAGKGITHSERPSKQLAAEGGENEFIQFWVNTPAQFKMETPYYLPLSDEDTPKLHLDKATIGVVAGTYQGIKGPAKTYSPQTLLRGTAQESANFDLELPESHNTLIYLLDGAMIINDTKAVGRDMVWFNQDGETIRVQALANTRFMVLSGEPIGEKVTSYGPFVMNEHTEILEALRDAQKGKMGILIEEF